MKPIVDATSTPLSSIFGSGFLIIVPILVGTVGSYAVLAMVVVCALAYAVGSVIRFNIRHAEPLLAASPTEATLSFERCSDFVLVIAYVISVCLYVHILSAFVLGGFGIDTDLNENLLTSSVIAVIMAIGTTRGLKTLDVLEGWALYVTLLIILLLILGFAGYDWTAWRSALGITFPRGRNHSAWEIATIVAGTLIVVQGFETTRYLGRAFDSDTRVRASHWSQIISSVVYVVFVALTLPVVHTLNGRYDDNSLIALVAVAAGLLAVPLIIAAALSQFSAAVADTLAATLNMQESTHGHLRARFGCVLVGGGAIALTWSANTLEIVALASRAFAFYYFLQCLVAISVSRSMFQRLGAGLLATVLAFITVFAIPAS